MVHPLLSPLLHIKLREEKAHFMVSRTKPKVNEENNQNSDINLMSSFEFNDTRHMGLSILSKC